MSGALPGVLSGAGPVHLRWLSERGEPELPVGTTWGVPWKKGALAREEVPGLRLGWVGVSAGSTGYGGHSRSTETAGSGRPAVFAESNEPNESVVSGGFGVSAGSTESTEPSRLAESAGGGCAGSLGNAGCATGGTAGSMVGLPVPGVAPGVVLVRAHAAWGEMIPDVIPDEELVPLQSWPTAFWPDGSVKWTAHAAVFGKGGSMRDAALAAGGPPSGCAAVRLNPNGQRPALAAGSALSVEELEGAIRVDTGAITCLIGTRGQKVIGSIMRGGAELCSGGTLVCLREAESAVSGGRVRREEPFAGRIHRAKVEQAGPVRAVVKLEGRHAAASGGSREWLPFTLRLYFYARLESIRFVYTFHYDGNPHQDFIKGLGISFALPMRGPLYNRHVRFTGGRGLFSESPKTLHTRRTKGRYRELFAEQTAGRAIAFDPEQDAYFLGLLDDSATWDAFKLVQDSSEHYRIAKRTGAGCSWVKAADGRRAGGLGYAGSEGGGLAVGLKDFWQKHPSAMEISGMAGEEAKFTVWFWSPDAGAMDLRHYDTKTHVESSYEGAEELRATPYGIANTSELTVWCTGGTPEPEAVARMAREAGAPSRLVCGPEYTYAAGAFGIWSLPDRSTPAKAYLEDRLDGIIAFYRREIEQRKWYGFWDYGDVMHSYDPVRHAWNYDLGGCAWQNTELAPNMWLWLTFLRTGREDVFRMAEAMTRHTSEVDAYHFGEYAGLGSRHNVVHWGCGCKEARIAMAGLHRYYYYLTADERIGDMMDEVKDADYSTVTLDPMRAYYPKDEHPTHIRVGPDWAAFSSNWMTRWERYEDEVYRDKIITGIGCLKAANFRLISGPTYGYDPRTGVLTGMGDDNWGRHLAICMGGPQVWFELAGMLEDPEWEEMLAEFGLFYNLPSEEKLVRTGGAVGGGRLRFEHPVLSVAIAAYGAYYHNDAATAALCWSILLDNDFGRVDLSREEVPALHAEEVLEVDWMNTNEASQWSLNAIISLELIDQFLPEQITDESASAAT
ncbi:hypothetical protein [Paenibacillus macerans]|uniref:exo-rhamnogalacturonan lyase family protein n=1 Tax=Paenibacillus macerans TaxID=44252 RepID=UPI002FD99895